MRVSEWGNSLGIRLPKELVTALGLKAGDEVEVVKASPKELKIAKNRMREEAIDRMRNTKWQLPEGYKFDREEANSRR